MLTTTFKNTRFLLLFLSLELLNSCKNNSAEPIAPLEPDAFGLRIFTNGSEVKDAVVKDKFLRHMAASNALFSVLPAFSSSDKVVFPTADTAVMNSNVFNRTKYSVVKTTPQCVFYSDVPNIVYATTLATSPASGRLMYDMLKYTSPLSPYPAGSIFARGKQVHVGYEHDKKMYMSVLRYHWVWPNQFQGSLWQSGWVLNEFNEGVIPQIGVGDTLASRFDKVALSM